MIYKIGSDLGKELIAKKNYFIMHTSGTDGSGGFHCEYTENMLVAKANELINNDPEQIKEFAHGLFDAVWEEKQK